MSEDIRSTLDNLGADAGGTVGDALSNEAENMLGAEPGMITDAADALNALGDGGVEGLVTDQLGETLGVDGIITEVTQQGGLLENLMSALEGLFARLKG